MRANETAAQQYLLELEAKVHSGGDLAESSSKPVFDAGREGLEFFRSFGPVYARYRDRDFHFKRDFADKYDAQREVGFAHLRADADRLRELHGVMSETTVDFRNSAGPLFGAWRGKAADQAQGNLDELVSAAGSTGSRIKELADAIDTVVSATARIAVGKAKSVRDLAAEDVGGLSSSDIDMLVTAADQGASPTDAALAELAKLCHVQADPKVCRTNKQVLQMVADDVSGWLDHVFVPFYEARQEAFDAICAEAAANFASAWDLLRKALNDTVSTQDETAAPAPERAVDDQLTAPTAKTAPPPAPDPAPAPAPAAGAPDTGGVPDTGDVAEALPVSGGTGDTPDGIGDAGDTGDRLEQGVETGSGETGMAGMTGSVLVPPPSSGGTAPSSAAPAGQPGYQGFYYPATGFGGAGGGERERHRRLPLSGEMVFDPPGDSAQASSFVIGGGDDETLYNDEDADARIENERPKRKPKDDIDEEDLW